MLSDMVLAGSFHHCIMTSGGRMANPARTVQLGSELTLPTRPAPHTAEIQAQANVTFVYLSCMLKSVCVLGERRCPKAHTELQRFATSTPLLLLHDGGFSGRGVH